MDDWDDQDWDGVDEFMRRLQSGWRSSSPADLSPMVPPAGRPGRRCVLAELIKMDQEARWQAGDHRLLEEYLAYWSELESDRNAIKELLEAECRTRLASGSAPTVAELGERFADVARQIDIDALIEEERQETGHGGWRETRTAERGDDCADVGERDPPVAAPGERFGHHEVRRLIRRGGMATVYEAEDTKLKRRVAVKVPHRYWQASPEARELFLKEAQAEAALRHPGIVTIYEFGQRPDGTCFLVLEYIEGDALDELIERKCVTKEHAAEWTAQIAEAIRYAHLRGFVHRDLKPGNVLVDSDGKIHLADFGLAVHESDQRQRAGESSGTRAYMAPEQVRGEVQWQDGRSDIWSLGVTLYQMLTGRRPFEGETAAEVCDEILNRDPKPLTEIDDTIPDELERICLKCLAKPPPQRYSNAAALARDLRRWQHPRRQRIWPLLATLSAVLAAIFIIWTLWPERTSPTSPEEPTTESDMGQPPAPVSLEGEITVTIWNEEVPGRRWLSIDEEDAVPVRRGDHLRIKAELKPRAYAYVVWIDTQGQAIPMYPWVDFDWSKRPDGELPVTEVMLPNDVEGFSMKGPPGTETLMLLVSHVPLSREVDMAQLLDALPPLRIEGVDSPLWFTNGEFTGRSGGPRGPKKAPEIIDDPLLRAQPEIQEKLRDYFSLNRTVYFPNAVE
jgi:serine/threonine protein kinase